MERPRRLRLRFHTFECDASFVPKDCSTNVLYVCDGCLTIFTDVDFYSIHRSVCSTPILGDILWSDESRNILFAELDGRKPSCAPTCRRAAKLATYFLDHKMTVDDAHYFGFFCLFFRDAQKNHFIGYFSKEWDVASAGDNNLACIFVLPPYQGRGYGKLLITLSYCFSALEARLGTPERPFSNQGARSFDQYWRRAVCAAILQLSKSKKPVTTQAICDITHMLADDVLVTLRRMKQPKTSKKLHAPLFVFSSADVIKASKEQAVSPSEVVWCGVEEV